MASSTTKAQQERNPPNKPAHTSMRTLSDSQLKQRIHEYSIKLRQCRQVSNRLKNLLTSRLQQVQKGCQYSRKAQQQRWALASVEYQDFVKEYLHIRHQGLQAKIYYDSLDMLYQARLSIRKWARNQPRQQ